MGDLGLESLTREEPEMAEELLDRPLNSLEVFDPAFSFAPVFEFNDSSEVTEGWYRTSCVFVSLLMNVNSGTPSACGPPSASGEGAF